VLGKNVVSTLDVNLQEYGEYLMQKFMGSIVALEPSTGEILCLITAPNYTPELLVGRARGGNYQVLSEELALQSRLLKQTRRFRKLVKEKVGLNVTNSKK